MESVQKIKKLTESQILWSIMKIFKIKKNNNDFR